MAKSSPKDIHELMQRAHDMAGIRLADIAADNQISEPENLTKTLNENRYNP